MRVAVGLIIALALAPDATAKCCALVTPPPPEGIAVGEKWRAMLDVQDWEYWGAQRPPSVVAWREGSRGLFSAEPRPTSRPEMFEVTVVFPEPGVWSYTVTFGGFAADAAGSGRTVTVAARREQTMIGMPYVPAVAGALLLALFGLQRVHSRSAEDHADQPHNNA